MLQIRLVLLLPLFFVAVEQKVVLGEEPDSLQALKEQAVQGDAKVQYDLGVRYHKGQGVPQEYTEALKWYRLAAAQGLAGAQYNLGAMYANGQGVRRDDVQTYQWFYLAAANATGEVQKKAAKARDTFAAKMTPAQRAKAQKLAREWQPTPQKQ